jgi:hypothetical protein
VEVGFTWRVSRPPQSFVRSTLMGLVSFSSPAETANERFWSVPFRFGNQLPTTWMLKCDPARLPCTCHSTYAAR